MKKLPGILGLVFIALTGLSQENPIQNGSLTACGGFLVDSGLSASDYGNNENFTMTLCPEAPETVINLYFNLFNLGDGDFLWVYDGPDINSPLFGQYTAFEAQGQDFYTGEGNASGCLTVVFQSDGADVGNFVAEISCGYPCERPFAIVETSENTDTLRVCVGEEIFFDASPSTVADGFEIMQWEWDFSEGATEFSPGPTISHSFNAVGDYKVQVYITDNNFCTNNNLTDVLVLVSTEPTFENSTQDVMVCAGLEADLNGVVTPVTWTGLPDNNFGGALFIPDDQFQCFDSEITFNSFGPGQTLTDVDDILNFHINFEHSYMGDLTITFICPSGQSMAVHQQGGGGTWLGEPIDNDADLTPGVGYDYYWAPDANNGTWAENGFFGTLPAGTYESVQPFDLLLGCPLNGTWTIEICDSWGSDNGFIFDWTINFDPDLFPEIITFTPTFDPGCDASFWEGPAIVSESADCNTATILHDEPGDYIYTYSATDNHGCTYTHEVNVEVVPRPEPSVTADFDQCTGIASLQSSVTNPNPDLQPYSYNWTPAELVNNPGGQNTTTQVLEETTTFTMTVFPVDVPGCITTEEVTIEVVEDEPMVVSISGANSPCPGTAIDLTVSIQGGYPEFTYSWDNNMTGSDITVSPQETTTYEVQVEGDCNSAGSATFTVEVTNPGTEITSPDLILCAGQYLDVEGELSGGDGNYIFFLPEEIELTDDNQIYSIALGEYTVEVIDGCIATGEFVITVADCQITIPNIISPNGDKVNDFFWIEGLQYYSNAELKVFNRWGNLVYESGNYKGDWSPSDVSDGVYFYTLNLPTGKTFSGTLTIVSE